MNSLQLHLRTTPLAIRFFSCEEHKTILSFFGINDCSIENCGICSIYWPTNSIEESTRSCYSIEYGFDDEDLRKYQELKSREFKLYKFGHISYYKTNNYQIIDFEDFVKKYVLFEIIDSLNKELNEA